MTSSTDNEAWTAPTKEVLKLSDMIPIREVEGKRIEVARVSHYYEPSGVDELKKQDSKPEESETRLESWQAGRMVVSL